MPDGLDLNAAELDELLRTAVDIMRQYYADLPQQPIMPDTTAATVRCRIAEPLPQHGVSASEALGFVRDVIFPLSRHNGHPRFFGYVASPGTAVSAVADLLEGVLNANVTSWRSGPAATEIEHLVIDWLKQVLGFPADGAGLLVSGGSMATFAALAAARSAKVPDITRTGVGTGSPMRIYVSEEGHFSIQKAASLLGIGSDNVQAIRTDAELRIDLADLRRCVEQDVASGFTPLCVVANAGTVSTGAVDDIWAVADIAQRHGLWLHVDAAYGGFAALAPSAKHLFAGIERADSVTLDPHKWLYTSLGCGCVLYRDANAARTAFAHDADYTRPIGLTRDDAFAFWDFGPELSRRFRALAVWLQFKVYGAAAIGRAIEQNIQCARYFAELVKASDDFEMLAPAPLSIFCFGYHPRGFPGDLNALNERILTELQRGGSSYVSNTRIRGQFALRGCVLNHRTTERDMRTLLEDTREAARRAQT